MRLLPMAVWGTGGIVSLYALVVRGDLTLDVGLGRRVRPLGPLSEHVLAPRHRVFDVISAPYLGRTPRALAAKLRVVERGTDMVLAEHFTKIRGFTVTTLETVRFSSPGRVDFRLVRGPVPYVVERFVMTETDGTTRLDYGGELGTDFWGIGEAWGNRVALAWEAAVRSSLTSIKVEAERRTTQTI